MDVTGSAYNIKPGTFDADLRCVGKGTPGGEFLRRYWHPISIIQDATERPRKVCVLGEDLILFRDKQGRPGLVYPRCAHRGTSLYYGKVENEGIRCCYHGWLFDVEGRCLEQPCEPNNGIGRARDMVRQPWYPVKEQYGFIFAYLGPPEKQPLLPQYDSMEDLADDEHILGMDMGLGTGRVAHGIVTPCNWLQRFENSVDPYHVPILHSQISGDQLSAEVGTMISSFKPEYAAHGIRFSTEATMPNGGKLERRSHVLMPTVRIVPDPFLSDLRRVAWILPVDDTHFKMMVSVRLGPDSPDPLRGAEKLENHVDTPEEYHQAHPNDWEAQVGQGPITLDSQEHLATSDRAIVMLRRLIRQQIKTVQDGGDPAGVNFDPTSNMFRVETGNLVGA